VVVKGFQRGDIIIFVLRIALGAVFLISGATKLPMNPVWFDVVRAYDILPYSVATYFAIVLPWVEFIMGLCLILGLFTRYISILSMLLVVSYVIANSIALSTDPVNTCECFGDLFLMSYEVALVVDGVLLISAVLVYWRRRGFMSLDILLNRIPGFNRLRLIN